jgi:hypothetical protein
MRGNPQSRSWAGKIEFAALDPLDRSSTVVEREPLIAGCRSVDATSRAAGVAFATTAEQGGHR